MPIGNSQSLIIIDFGNIKNDSFKIPSVNQKSTAEIKMPIIGNLILLNIFSSIWYIIIDIPNICKIPKHIISLGTKNHVTSVSTIPKQKQMIPLFKLLCDNLHDVPDMKIKSPANISLNRFICAELNISILTPNINTKSKNRWYITIKIIDIPLNSSINPTLFPKDFFLLATFISQSFLATLVF